jgi:hypothetical protein
MGFIRSAICTCALRLAFACCAITQAATVNYNSNEGHFSMQVPAGWKRYTSSEMAQLRTSFKAAQFAKWETGWHAPDDLPNVIVAHEMRDMKSVSDSELASVIVNNIRKSAQDVDLKGIAAEQQLSVVNWSEKPSITYNPMGKFFRMTMSMKVTAFGQDLEMRCVTYGFVGMDRITYLYFFFLPDQIGEADHAISAVSSSFQFSPGFEHHYQPAALKTNYSSWDNSIYWAATGPPNRAKPSRMLRTRPAPAVDRAA